MKLKVYNTSKMSASEYKIDRPFAIGPVPRRDVRKSSCYFVKWKTKEDELNDERFGEMYGVIECLHGNWIIKDADNTFHVAVEIND